jgi:5-formyltetrahydrofolate cyclo-ligase
MPDASASKAEWRSWAKFARPQLPDVSESVCSHLQQFLLEGSLEQGGQMTVLAYWALPGEVQLGALVMNLPAITWLTTRIQPGQQLSLHEYALASVPNPLGILEPAADAPSVPFASVNVVLAPGLVFDARGARLGFGRGFYDRLFTQLRPDVLRIGVTCEALMVDRLPSDPWDVPMTHLATEGGVRGILLDSIS